MQKSSNRILVLGLDGLEHSLCERYMAEGAMPNLKRLTAGAAAAKLDHGRAKDTGLGWEHFSSGRAPAEADRWAAVDFNPLTYAVEQRPTRLAPFADSMRGKVVVFDAPYFDMARAPAVRGLVNWGAHDPGVDAQCNPAGLTAEVAARFGPYPAADCIYGFTWPNRDRTVEVGDTLARSVERRAEVAHWLLAERLPDWDLAIVVVGEPHCVVEPMWHGVDAGHPLHGIDSAAASGEAVARVFEALDRLIGRLTDAFPDALCVMFAMHGMGPNTGDVPSMALLPELLYRHRFGRALLEPRPQWRDVWPVGLAPHEDWDGAVRSRLVHERSPGERWRAGLRALYGKIRRTAGVDAGLAEHSLDWMPAAHYRRYWPSMPAFAVPAFYDGRVRVNLEGREGQGIVASADYGRVVEEVTALVTACRDAHTGAPVVADVTRCDGDPYALNGSGSDIEILFQGCSTGWQHPEFGVIGPLPFRRTGGHTGDHGIAWFAGNGLAGQDLGTRSAFDVVPTLFALMGQAVPAGLSGTPIELDRQ